MQTKIVIEKNKFFQNLAILFGDVLVAILIVLQFSINVGYASRSQTLFALLLGLILLFFLYINYKLNWKTYWYLFLLAISGLLNSLFLEGATVLYLTYDLLICFPIAMYFVKVNFSRWFWKVFSIVSAMFIIYKLITSINPYQIFPVASRNYISVFMIFAMFLFCISDTRSKFALRNIFIFAIVSFMASVMAVGRGGIISTAFLLIITLLMLFKGSSLQKRILLTLFSFVGIYFLMMNIDYVLDVYLVRFTNQNVSESNYERSYFVVTYLQTMLENPFYLLFGVSRQSLFQYRVLNFHNSYLQFHFTYGLIPLITSAVLFRSSLKQLYSQRKFAIFALGLCFLTRAMLDMLFPAHLLTVVLYYFCLLSVENKSVH
ncbi:TPA: hypothetical protein U1212_002237 [Streptococcus suis]|nr:hypothetical protein [Streptococcus suis]NQK57935.1 hypothetical protein [Streptococcus suis]HEM2741473.1 hypothetical protein [Streptococcus suis]HEM5071563.1 hypothetical protein [Streptococcus suis]HEM6285115.1 hypothetical protein [Streptococcus suis]